MIIFQQTVLLLAQMMSQIMVMQMNTIIIKGLEVAPTKVNEGHSNDISEWFQLL